MTWHEEAHPRGGDPTNRGRWSPGKCPEVPGGTRALRAGDLASLVDWPAHEHETVTWRPSGRGTREDLQFTELQVSIPPLVADLDLAVPGEVAAAAEDAVLAVARLDATYAEQLSTFGSFLVRSEAVSSSRIEHEDTSLDDVARASINLKSTESARATVAAAVAVQRMVSDADSGHITTDSILAAHHSLLGRDRLDGPDAGRWRTVQNWIGGSSFTPRGAVHVPPPPHTVPGLMDDLVAFVNRDDVPVLVQAAVAHAQFESIHPFTDGNGRIGRALINAVLRRRNVTRSLVVPIASALVADTGAYFASVNAYRDGHAGQFVAHLAHATRRAADESGRSALVLAELPDRWRQVVHPRAGSAAAAILDMLLEYPALDAEAVVWRTGSNRTSVYQGLDRLTEAGILHELTGSKRDRAWAATAVMDELNDLNRRLGAPGRP